MNNLTSSRGAFVNGNPQAIQVSGKGVSLSKIFDWHRDDFAAAGGAVAFINRYRKEPLPADARVKFMDYDWSLNEAKWTPPARAP